LAIPRLNYFLRCAPTWVFQNLLEEYDTTLRLSLEKILNIRLLDHSYNQACLPVRDGDLGFRKAPHLAVTAFLASTNFVSELIQSLLPGYILEKTDQIYEDSMDLWKVLSLNAEIPSGLSSLEQSSWESPINKITKDNLKSCARNQNNVDQARHLRTEEKESMPG